MTKVIIKPASYKLQSSNECGIVGAGLDLQKYIQDVVYQLTLSRVDCCGREYNFGSGGSVINFDCDRLTPCLSQIQSFITKEYIQDTLGNSFSFATYNDSTNQWDINNSVVISLITRELIEDLLANSFPSLVYNDTANAFQLIPSSDANNAFILGSDNRPFVNGSAFGTNLNISNRTSTDFLLLSSTGTDITIPPASTTLAGLLIASDKIKLNHITVNQAVNLDDIESWVTNLVTLSGLAANSLDLGTFSGNIITDNVSIKTALQELETSIVTKQDKITFQDEGVNLGAAGEITTVDFVGTNVNAVRTGGKLTVTISGGGGSGGGTSLDIANRNINTLDITSDTGGDVTIPSATATLSGLLVGSDKQKLDHISVTQAVNLDTMETNLSNLISLSGVAANAINLGTFTGSIIPDNLNIKQAFQAIEDAINDGDSVTNGITGNGKVGTPHKLGGLLTEDTVINGSKLRSLDFINLREFSIISEFDDELYDSISAIESSETSGTPFQISQIDKLVNERRTTLKLTSDGSDSEFAYQDFSNPSINTLATFAPSDTEVRMRYRSGASDTSLYIDDDGIKASNLPTRTSETQYVFWNGATKQFVRGNIPNTALVEYQAMNASNTKVRVVATASGVTAAWSAGELIVTVPESVLLISCHVIMTNASNVQTSADTSGANNWIRVKFTGTTGVNTDRTDIKIPSVQKNLFASGSPSLTNPFTVDIDNNPNVACVGVGSNSVTLRIWNLSIANGASFTFNGF